MPSFLFLAFFLVSVNSQVRFPNIDYAGMGYDEMKGNPQSISAQDGNDPGWREPLFNLSVNGTVTPDGRYILPYGLTGVECGKCTSLRGGTYFQIAGSVAYRQTLEKNVNMEVDSFFSDVAFSASADFLFIYDETLSAQSAFTCLFSECCVYQTGLEIYDPPPLRRNFANAVATMPLSYTGHESWFATFIDQFGTAYPIRMSFGGKYGFLWKLAGVQWSLFESSTLDMQESATYSAILLSGGSSTMTSIQISQAEFFQGYTSDHYEFQLPPGIYPANNSVDAWRQAVIVNPMPIAIREMSSIVNLLTRLYFPNDNDIHLKAAALSDAYKNYCKFLFARQKVRSCVPIPDPPIPKPSIFGGLYTVDQCNAHSVKNPYSHDFHCPSNYSPYDVARTLTPSGCGQNTFLCLLNGYKEDPLRTFGGMFSKGKSGLSNKSNPLSGTVQCPGGYTEVARGYTKDPDDSSWSSQYSCFNNTTPLDSTQIGGFFQQPDSTPTNCFIYNQYQHGFACPPGNFKAYKIAHVQTCGAGKNQNAWQYICLNNVF